MSTESDIARGQSEFLSALADLAERAGAELIARDARSLAERVEDGDFYLACVGQFKRGKSTLLDALLGEAVLPVGVVPVTAIPTIVRYGPGRRARVRFELREWQDIPVEEIGNYVSEIENPENTKSVRAVEVFLPNDFLARGVRLVDTPGIGSVFEMNTAATLEFIPHVDAALIVLGADPPISADELGLITQIATDIPDLIFVLNKADRVQPEECAQAKEFTEDILARRLHRPVRLFELSAKEELERETSSREWLAFFETLCDLVQSSKRRIVAGAAARGIARLPGLFSAALREERQFLTAPIEALRQRERVVDRLVADAELAVRELTNMMNSEQRRAVRSFTDHRTEFLRTIETKAHRDLGERLNGGPALGPRYRRWAFQHAYEVAEAIVFPWLAEEQLHARAEYQRIRDRFGSMATELLDRMDCAGVTGLDRETAADAIADNSDFDRASAFQFLRLMRVTRPASPFLYAADIAIGLTVGVRRIARDAEDVLDRLLEINTSRVQRDLDDRLTASRGRLERAIRKVLDRSVESTRSMFQKIVATRSSGQSAVSGEVARIQELEAEIARLLFDFAEVNARPQAGSPTKRRAGLSQ